MAAARGSDARRSGAVRGDARPLRAAAGRRARDRARRGRRRHPGRAAAFAGAATVALAAAPSDGCSRRSRRPRARRRQRRRRRRRRARRRRARRRAAARAAATPRRRGRSSRGSRGRGTRGDATRARAVRSPRRRTRPPTSCSRPCARARADRPSITVRREHPISRRRGARVSRAFSQRAFWRHAADRAARARRCTARSTPRRLPPTRRSTRARAAVASASSPGASASSARARARRTAAAAARARAPRRAAVRARAAAREGSRLYERGRITRPRSRPRCGRAARATCACPSGRPGAGGEAKRSSRFFVHARARAAAGGVPRRAASPTVGRAAGARSRSGWSSSPRSRARDDTSCAAVGRVLPRRVQLVTVPRRVHGYGPGASGSSGLLSPTYLPRVQQWQHTPRFAVVYACALVPASVAPPSSP